MTLGIKSRGPEVRGAHIVESLGLAACVQRLGMWLALASTVVSKGTRSQLRRVATVEHRQTQKEDFSCLHVAMWVFLRMIMTMSSHGEKTVTGNAEQEKDSCAGGGRM